MMNCKYCGKEFIPKRRPDQITCGGDECRKKLIRERSKSVYRENARKKEEQRQKRKKNGTLTEIAKRARECGMTYGQYVAMQEKI